jgi:hypothetical protein
MTIDSAEPELPEDDAEEEYCEECGEEIDYCTCEEEEN